VKFTSRGEYRLNEKRKLSVRAYGSSGFEAWPVLSTMKSHVFFHLIFCGCFANEVKPRKSSLEEEES
jgi:hypothetical protein